MIRDLGSLILFRFRRAVERVWILRNQTKSDSNRIEMTSEGCQTNSMANTMATTSGYRMQIAKLHTSPPRLSIGNWKILQIKMHHRKANAVLLAKHLQKLKLFHEICDFALKTLSFEDTVFS